MPVRAEQNHRLNWPNIIDMKEYLDTIKALLKENKTTGGNHSEAMLHYSKMNLSRMKRWMKSGVVNPELEEAVKAISEPQTWVVLTEAWCGDAAPVLAGAARLCHGLAMLLPRRPGRDAAGLGSYGDLAAGTPALAADFPHAAAERRALPDDRHTPLPRA